MSHARLPFKIIFRKTIPSRFFSHFSWFLTESIRRQLFVEVQLTVTGITVPQFLRPPFEIPWSSINCLDLALLKPIEISWISELNWFSRFLLRDIKSSRMFSILCDEELLKGRFFGGRRQIWFAGRNCSVFTQIELESAETLRLLLESIAAEKKIKLDTVVLDG
jgi:hypothetical protein